jgi:apolipoprotein N-acyltransferase
VLNLLLSLLTAALLILSFPRFSVAWLAPFALAPLLIAVVRERRAYRRFLLGWVAGVVYWFGACYWIQFVLSVHGGVGDVAGWALLCLFALAKGLHMGVFALVAAHPMRRWWAAPAVAALWVAIEVTHGSLGFAWLALGNAGVNMSAVMRLAPVTGVYGISFVFAVAGTTVALACLRRPRLHYAWVLAFPALYLLPALPPLENGRETALLVQPNVSETEDWTEQSLEAKEREMTMTSLRGAMADPKRLPSVIVWPEVPAPFYYEQDPQFKGYVDTLARTLKAYVLAGVVGRTPDSRPLNSAVLISPEGRLETRYDKVNLVPFGEFVPWPFGFANKISNQTGDFAAGERVVVARVEGGRKIGTFICYESVFPDFVRKFVASGAGVLFNISNDGWFGKSAARFQHLSIVRMRAAENRRWILRATNDGVTAVIDPAGRVRQTLPLYTEATAVAPFSYVSETSLYTRFGNWFPILCAMFGALALIAEAALPGSGTTVTER